MNIPKAIEILQLLPDPDHTVWEPVSLDAIKLGIEALKKWQFVRTHSGWSCETLLPGETKD